MWKKGVETIIKYLGSLTRLSRRLRKKDQVDTNPPIPWTSNV